MQSATYRRRQIEKAVQQGEAIIEQAVQPVLDARFKSLNRELRQGNLRKKLKKHGGDYSKAYIPADGRSWSPFFRETLRKTITEGGSIVWQTEQNFFIANGYDFLRIDPLTVLDNYLNRVDTRITDIGVRTEKNVLKEIGEWFNTEESLPELIERLSKWFNPARARLIASTEMAYAASAVALNMMETYGVQLWQWDAFRDGRTCEVCMDLMKESKRSPFTLDDPMPPDPSHPGCRCGVYFIGVDVQVKK